MEFLKLAEERYSVRKMTSEKVKQEDLDKILEDRLPDYLVVSHMEPDHSAGIVEFIKKISD